MTIKFGPSENCIISNWQQTFFVDWQFVSVHSAVCDDRIYIESRLFHNHSMKNYALGHQNQSSLKIKLQRHTNIHTSLVKVASNANCDNCKVEVLLEGHNFLRNYHLRFDVYYILFNLTGRFCQFLWPS